MGIAVAFPEEYAYVLQEVGLEKIDGKKVLLNPGFTAVTALDEVIEVMDKMFEVRK